MVLQVALLGSRILAERTEELTGVQVELHVLLEVAAICRLVLTVWTGKRFGTVMDLPGMAGHLMLVGCQVITTLALEGTLTCTQEGKHMSKYWGGGCGR